MTQYSHAIKVGINHVANNHEKEVDKLDFEELPSVIHNSFLTQHARIRNIENNRKLVQKFISERDIQEVFNEHKYVYIFNDKIERILNHDLEQ